MLQFPDFVYNYKQNVLVVRAINQKYSTINLCFCSVVRKTLFSKLKLTDVFIPTRLYFSVECNKVTNVLEYEPSREYRNFKNIQMSTSFEFGYTLDILILSLLNFLISVYIFRRRLYNRKLYYAFTIEICFM